MRRLAASIACLSVGPFTASQDPEAVRIEHAAVECVVAGLHPEISACFDPDAAVAQARVFFRARADRHWYYVTMAPKGSCRSAFLPKPRRSAKAIRYYVESSTRGFATTRTDEREAEIRGRNACATPAVAKAAVVVSSLAGGPAIPVGFGAGVLSAPAVVGVVAAGAAVGGAVVVGGSDGGGGPSSTRGSTTTAPGSGGATTTLPGSTTTSTTVPGSTTTSTSTTLPGTTTSTTLPGTTTSTTVPGSTTTTTTSTTSTTVPPCPDQTRPQTAIVVPTNGLVVSLTTPVVATASDNVGVTRVEFLVDGNRFASQTAAPYSVLWNTTKVPNGNHVLTTRAHDACGNTRTSSGVTVRVLNLLASGREGANLLTSDLQLPGGVIQIVVGRQAAHFVREGTTALPLPPIAGELWLELTVVEAVGRAGEWRVGLTGATSPLGIRVLAGDVLALEPAAVTLRLAGRRGERAVLVFRAG